MKVNVRGKNKYVPSEKEKRVATEKIQKLNQYFKNSDNLDSISNLFSPVEPSLMK